MNVPSNWCKKSFAIWKLILWAPFSATLHYHNRSLPGRRKQRTKNTTKIDPSCPGGPYLTMQFEKIQDWHMKNAINISNNVNLILNTYRYFFFQTATENLRCCLKASTMLCKTFQQDKQSGNGKMIDVCVWNVIKLTEARTKMEVCKLRTRATQWLTRCYQTK